MITASAHRIAALICFAILLVPTFALAGPTDDDRVRDLVKQGGVLFANGDAKGAEAKFLDAWALKKTTDVAGNLGSVELELKEYDRAATHFAFCERNLQVSTPKAQHDALEAQLAEAKKHVGTLALDVSPAGVEIDIDGTSAGRSPLDGPVFLNPGDHLISAKRDGLVPKDVTVTLKAGEEHAEKIVLKPVLAATPGAPSSSAPKTETPPEGPNEHRSVIPGAVMLGIGAAFTIPGVTLLGLTALKDSEAKRLGRGLVCAPARMDAGCSTLGNVVSTYNTFLVTGAVGTGVGLAVAGVGIGYLAWPSRGSSLKASLVPVFTPGSVGVLMLGSF